MAKTKALISFAVTAKLICVFVFAYADCLLSCALLRLILYLVCAITSCFNLCYLSSYFSSLQTSDSWKTVFHLQCCIKMDLETNFYCRTSSISSKNIFIAKKIFFCLITRYSPIIWSLYKTGGSESFVRIFMKLMMFFLSNINI